MAIRLGMSWRTASSKGSAEAGAASVVTARRAAASLFMCISSGRRDELDHVDDGFEMGIREDEPPAAIADPLEKRDHVAVGVAAIAHDPFLVAELVRAQEDHAALAVREKPADRPLRSGQLDEAHRPFGAGRLDPALERRISDIVEQPFG